MPVWKHGLAVLIPNGMHTVQLNAVNSLATLIAEHPFLMGMRPAHLDVLSACAMQTRFPKDQLIFREGDLANRFYLIESGSIALESHADDAHRVLIQTVGGGEVLGWSWLFPPYYWHFDARTLQPTNAVFFYGTRLRTQCEEDHDFGYELIKRMASVAIRRLQAAREQMVEFYGHPERCAAGEPDNFG